MKKYRQLLLLILSAVSVSLLLIYRRQYNQLHYVLEVFNFFGQPCNLTDLIESNNVVNHHDWGPIPVWTEDDNFYVYSSFWSETEVKSIVSVKNKSDHARSCYLWYEDLAEPVISKFKYARFGKDDDKLFEAYYYICTSNEKKTPYAVSYKRKKKNLTKHILKIDKNKIIFNMTICVPPTAITKSAFIEFLSYHSLVGVDSFLIYTNSLPYRLTKIVQNLSNRLNINITFFPWNFPIQESTLTNILVENDCILRTINQSKYISTLNVNEYLVSSTHYSINDVFIDYHSESDRLNLAVQKFCIKYRDPRKPMAVQNIETVHSDDHQVKIVFKNSNHNGNVISAEGVDKGSMSLHRYEICEDENPKTYVDNSILKFSTDFSRATLVQLLLNKRL